MDKALISDIGGVLLTVSFDRAIAAWSRSAGCEAGALRARFAFDREFQAFEVNGLTPAAYLDHLRESLGVALSGTELTDGWNDIYLGIDEDVAAVFAELRTAGVRVVGVTNTNVLHHAYWSVRFATLAGAFDALYSSIDLSSRKPESRFFEHVLEAERLRPGQVVFFDDIEENVAGAASCGLAAHRYESPAQMRAVLAVAGYPCRPAA